STKGTLKGEIDSSVQSYLAASRAFLAVVNSGVLNPANITLTPAELYTNHNALMSALFNFYDSSIAWEDKALLAREDFFNSAKRATLLGVFFLLMLSTALVYFIIRSITIPL